jgi:hypothetical protein
MLYFRNVAILGRNDSEGQFLCTLWRYHFLNYLLYKAKRRSSDREKNVRYYVSFYNDYTLQLSVKYL